MTEPQLIASKRFTFPEGTLKVEVFSEVIRSQPDPGIFTIIRYEAFGLEPFDNKIGIISDPFEWYVDDVSALRAFENYNVKMAEDRFYSLRHAYFNR